MALVLDIETVGAPVEEIPERALDYLYRALERDAPDEEELERRRQDLEERFGLDPATGRIICIGCFDTETDEETVFYGGEEVDILKRFWAWLANHPPELLVTFNGKRFDLPYLNVRSAIHSLTPSVQLPDGRHTRRPHFDVQEVLSADDRRRRGGLDYFCAIFGLDSPKSSLDGSQIATAYADGRIEEIARYCLADCRATGALFERLKSFYL